MPTEPLRPTDSHGLDPHGPRALVAEDEAIIRLDLVELLHEHGVSVVGQASNGEEAVRLAVELSPDIVFLDIAMPIRDGLSAAAEIRVLRLAPVVMLTAYGQREVAQQAAAAGAMGYLVKPFVAADLVTTMEIAFVRWAELMNLDGKVQALEVRIQQRQLVDRAKALVQQDMQMSESEAFAWLRRQAMDRRVTLAEFASQLLVDKSS